MKNRFTLKTRLVLGIAIMFALGSSVLAQANMEVYKAELSVPFGEVEGKVVAVGDQLVFVDDDKPEFSFAIERSNISSVASDGKILTVETKREVKDRSGMKSRFVMRVFDGGSEKLEKWLKGNSGFSAKNDANYVKTNSSTNSGMIYEAKHAHRLYGSCTGKLIVGDDRFSYESSDDREHSRQWLLADIKTIKRNSPYKFQVKLFKGDGYELEILGNGIDITDFKVMENKLAMEKANR